MKLEHYSQEHLTKELLAIFSQFIDLSMYRVFFFGSRVTGTSHPGSDIDVGIEGDKAVPLSSLSKIIEAVDGLEILYKIDIVDFANVDNAVVKSVSNHKEYLT